jgi:exopolysaccharide biosynthesis polyprenyl glycosylphosphotransferase
MTFRQEPLQIWLNRAAKRGFDIAFSSLVILLVFPWLFPVVALCIKLDSRGPVIFRQQRSGRRNQAFTCYKFRTMREESEEARRRRVYGGQRVTRVGAFLRKTSIDELPQFINVLLGQMSVVGPRPHMLQHTEEYSKLIEKYLVRHFVSPGITGYAQVHGLRGEISDPYLMKKRLEYDTWYMENWSLPLDVKIVLMTITNVLRGEENAY